MASVLFLTNILEAFLVSSILATCSAHRCLLDLSILTVLYCICCGNEGASSLVCDVYRYVIIKLLRSTFSMPSVGNSNVRTEQPILFGRCPSLSAHESESILRTYVVCRENIRRHKQLAHGKSTHYLLITAIL
jgi:hypothetical protein